MWRHELVGWAMVDVRRTAAGGHLLHPSLHALRQYTRLDLRPWTARHAWLALGLSCTYAITDELHQCCVPGRQGAMGDVLLDSLGAACGLLLLWLAGRWSKRW